MTHRPHLRFHELRAISYNSRSHLVFMQSKVNSARYNAQVVNSVLLPFIRQEGGVLSARQRTSTYSCCNVQRALHGGQQLPWLA